VFGNHTIQKIYCQQWERKFVCLHRRQDSHKRERGMLINDHTRFWVETQEPKRKSVSFIIIITATESSYVLAIISYTIIQKLYLGGQLIFTVLLDFIHYATYYNNNLVWSRGSTDCFGPSWHTNHHHRMESLSRTDGDEVSCTLYHLVKLDREPAYLIYYYI
jgi:hypothetical protein